jgi:hypothetical protein
MPSSQIANLSDIVRLKSTANLKGLKFSYKLDSLTNSHQILIKDDNLISHPATNIVWNTVCGPEDVCHNLVLAEYFLSDYKTPAQSRKPCTCSSFDLFRTGHNKECSEFSPLKKVVL